MSKLLRNINFYGFISIFLRCDTSNVCLALSGINDAVLSYFLFLFIVNYLIPLRVLFNVK